MNKTFVVKPDTKEVVCHFKHKPESILREVLDNCSEHTIQVVAQLGELYSYSSNPKYKAVAKCDPRDEFNEAVGKDIAESKCSLKYHIAREKQYRHLIKVLNKAVVELTKLADIHDIKTRRIQEDLERMYGDK